MQWINSAYALAHRVPAFPLRYKGYFTIGKLYGTALLYTEQRECVRTTPHFQVINIGSTALAPEIEINGKSNRHKTIQPK
jgi:hypothetical protein